MTFSKLDIAASVALSTTNYTTQGVLLLKDQQNTGTTGSINYSVPGRCKRVQCCSLREIGGRFGTPSGTNGRTTVDN